MRSPTPPVSSKPRQHSDARRSGLAALKRLQSLHALLQIGRDGERLLIFGDGLVTTAERGQDVSFDIVHIGAVGIERQRLIDIEQALLRLALFQVGLCPSNEGLGVTRLKFTRPVVVG